MKKTDPKNRCRLSKIYLHLSTFIFKISPSPVDFRTENEKNRIRFLPKKIGGVGEMSQLKCQKV